MLPEINRESIYFNADDKNYKILKAEQDKYLKDSGTHKDSVYEVALVKIKITESEKNVK